MGLLLVVDDDERFCRAIERWLTARGHTVVSAKDATSALAVINAEPINHALVDFCLSNASGGDVARALLAESRNIHLAFVTAWPERASKDADILGVEILEKPATPAHILEWMATVEFTQHEACSGRRDVVPLRKVLYVAVAPNATLPGSVVGRVITRTKDAYDELPHSYDLVLVDGAHPGLERVIGTAVEHGCCVYVVASNPRDAERAHAAGAVGVLSPKDIPQLADIPLRKPSLRVPILPWVRAKAVDIMTSALPHEQKMEALERLLLEDAAARHGSDRVAAAAVGLPRATFQRRLTPHSTTVSDESTRPVPKPGHPRKR
jgi:DNA-binding NtrC family response regulator